MSSTADAARAAILGRLGRALGPAEAAKDARRAAVATWADSRESGGARRPERATRNGGARLRQFVEEAARNRSVVIEIGDLDELPGVLGGYLRGRNVGGPLRVAPHPDFDGLDWAPVGAGDVRTGRATADDAVSVSIAASAAAETGSVVFVGGPSAPVTLHVLPLHHVSVVYASRVDAGYETALARARGAFGPGTDTMPRHLNIITGPSRTADIEQTLLMGAHGPQAEVVVLVKDR